MKWLLGPLIFLSKIDVSTWCGRSVNEPLLQPLQLFSTISPFSQQFKLELFLQFLKNNKEIALLVKWKYHHPSRKERFLCTFNILWTNFACPWI
ncbi:hypothetical protein PRIO_2219 [Paenibacillus riograndensis SBR5]|uniref:Uncharacterized protein n=1 Tax=Paenibacillus riograndensis SBR5 TaxID=1073571 RepID=A0A0E3WH41_9BACL|nr:hypothetical protein PRIO_2219 [Paenibacillus riograndensis SBR5]